MTYYSSIYELIYNICIYYITAHIFNIYTTQYCDEYLTIRLRTRHFYHLIEINFYHLTEINPIVFVKKTCVGYFIKIISKNEEEPLLFLRKIRPSRATRSYSISIDE